ESYHLGVGVDDVDGRQPGKTLQVGHLCGVVEDGPRIIDLSRLGAGSSDRGRRLLEDLDASGAGRSPPDEDEKDEAPTKDSHDRPHGEGSAAPDDAIHVMACVCSDCVTASDGTGASSDTCSAVVKKVETVIPPTVCPWAWPAASSPAGPRISRASSSWVWGGMT